MKWKKKYTPLDGERTVTRFLFLPVQIDDEIRWLEKATLRETLTTSSILNAVWVPIEFINK